MATEQQTPRAVLRALCVIGYVNLVALIGLLWCMKSTAVSWLVIVPPLVAISGTGFYAAAWSRVFPEISKVTGRKVMRAYLLGVYVMLGTVALFAVLMSINALTAR